MPCRPTRATRRPYRAYLKQRVESLAMGDKIFNILVPKEKKIKVKGGRRTTIEEKIYPGYVLVEMILTEDSWYVVRNTPRVTGFVGPDNTTPTPLSRDEVDALLSRSDNHEEKMIDRSPGGRSREDHRRPVQRLRRQDRGSERGKRKREGTRSHLRQGYGRGA